MFRLLQNAYIDPAGEITIESGTPREFATDFWAAIYTAHLRSDELPDFGLIPCAKHRHEVHDDDEDNTHTVTPPPSALFVYRDIDAETQAIRQVRIESDGTAHFDGDDYAPGDETIAFWNLIAETMPPELRCAECREEEEA